MTIYISCHGEKQPAMPDTFVPRYTAQIKFYAEADENLNAANELGALARADLGIGAPSDVYPAGGTIPNYILTPDSSQEAALATFFEPSGGTLYLIPQQLALCMFDGQDETGQFRPCDETEGIRYCTGLFGPKAWQDSSLQGDIVMLCCRGISGRQNARTRPLGGDAYTMDAVSDFLDRFTAADENAKAALWDDPELPEGTRVTMLTMRSVAEWVQVRQARGVATTYGDLAVLSSAPSSRSRPSSAPTTSSAARSGAGCPPPIVTT